MVLKINTIVLNMIITFLCPVNSLGQLWKNCIWIIFDQIHQIQGSNTNPNTITGLFKKSNTNTLNSNTNTQIQIRIWPHPWPPPSVPSVAYCTAWYGSTTTLVYSNYPKEAAASTHLAIMFGRITSGVPWFLHSTAVPINAAPASVQALSVQCHCQCKYWCWPWYPKTTGKFSVKFRSLTWDELPSAIFWTSRSIWACLGIIPKLAQNPLSVEWRKTLSTTHHALSPYLHVIIYSAFISSKDCTVFIELQCHLKHH